MIELMVTQVSSWEELLQILVLNVLQMLFHVLVLLLMLYVMITTGGMELVLVQLVIILQIFGSVKLVLLQLLPMKLIVLVMVLMLELCFIVEECMPR